MIHFYYQQHAKAKKLSSTTSQAAIVYDCYVTKRSHYWLLTLSFLVLLLTSLVMVANGCWCSSQRATGTYCGDQLGDSCVPHMVYHCENPGPGRIGHREAKLVADCHKDLGCASIENSPTPQAHCWIKAKTSITVN